MQKLLMISGDRTLAEGKRGAFYNTLEGFHKYWERIDIICPPISNFQFPISKEPKSYFANVFIHTSPWPLLFQPFWILREGFRILKTNNYKLETKNYLMTVHEYPPFYNGIGARGLWNKTKIPYVLEIHHIPGFPKAAGFKERFYRNFLRFFIKTDSAKAVAIRTVNQKQVPEFLAAAGIPKNKILYIPSVYLDLQTFKPMTAEKKYDLVFAARLEENKGINLLLQAILKVKTEKPDIKLLIIGSGTLKIKIQEYIQNHDLEGNVFLSGWLETADDVAAAYNSAKIFINPSFNEGGPRVVLEAMACGLPVITTRVGIAEDIIQDGENGLFTSWEPKDMVDKILYLLGDQELRQKFSQAGFGIVREFKKEPAIENYAKKIQSLIK